MWWHQTFLIETNCVCVCVYALTFNCPCRIHCKSSSPLSYRLWLHICSDLWHNIKLKMSDHLITICCPSGKLKCSTVFLSFFLFRWMYPIYVIPNIPNEHVTSFVPSNNATASLVNWPDWCEHFCPIPFLNRYWTSVKFGETGAKRLVDRQSLTRLVACTAHSLSLILFVLSFVRSFVRLFIHSLPLFPFAVLVAV